jgi:hypothetical protein
VTSAHAASVRGISSAEVFCVQEIVAENGMHAWLLQYINASVDFLIVAGRLERNMGRPFGAALLRLFAHQDQLHDPGFGNGWAGLPCGARV